MDALEVMRGTDAVFKRTQQQYADMQGFAAPRPREGTVMAGGGFGSSDSTKPTMELPTARSVGLSPRDAIDPTRQTPTWNTNENGYDAADHQAAADIPGFGTQGWTDIGPVGRAAMTMAEALPGIGAISRAASMGMNMSNVTYADNVREQMGLDRFDAFETIQGVMGLNVITVRDLGNGLNPRDVAAA